MTKISHTPETLNGYGQQFQREAKKMHCIKSTLEEASMQLGMKSGHVRLQELINAAIEEANAIACGEEDAVNDNR